MTKIEKYLLQHAESDIRPLYKGEHDGIKSVVVIPVLAENEFLFATLASLARNPSCELRQTLVICVINNRRKKIAQKEDVIANQIILNYLRKIISRAPLPQDITNKWKEEDIRRIMESDLRLACLDASSECFAMPEKKGGVGLARKIGMDRALEMFDHSVSGQKLIFCLDADTLVDDNYLSSVREYFKQEKKQAAVIAYAHQKPDDQNLRAAICNYEIYLRYYLLGLEYAGSPYAIHTIGSTIVCSPDAYVSVRGMPQRDAAEDFYFLNKLAKTGDIGKISTTRVYPSARISKRVPFGTGQRVSRFVEGVRDEYVLYDPRIFNLLKQWFHEMTTFPERDLEAIRLAAKGIDPLLDRYLHQSAFYNSWEKISRQNPNPEYLRNQFHVWFDAFRTLKLVHYLTDKGLSPVPMSTAIAQILTLMGNKYPLSSGISKTTDPDVQWEILEYLRNVSPV